MLTPVPANLVLRVRATYEATMANQDCTAGRYADAERRVRRALRVAPQLQPCDPRLELRLWNMRGMVAKYRCRFRAAARAYARAMQLVASHPDREALATLWHNLGGLEHARGRYGRAEVYARRGLALRMACLGDRHVDVGRDLAALAAILDGSSRHEEALRLHRQALAIFTHRLVPERREEAHTLANLAACLHALGRRREAEATAVRALTIGTRALGRAHPQRRTSYA